VTVGDEKTAIQLAAVLLSPNMLSQNVPAGSAEKSQK
jgi:hypothetical protein